MTSMLYNTHVNVLCRTGRLLLPYLRPGNILSEVHLRVSLATKLFRLNQDYFPTQCIAIVASLVEVSS